MNWNLVIAGILLNLLPAVFFVVFDRVLFRIVSRRKKIVRQQTYGQLKRSRDSLLFVFTFFGFWVLTCYRNIAGLIDFLGIWTGLAFFALDILLYSSAWLVFYLLDRRKSVAEGPDQSNALV